MSRRLNLSSSSPHRGRTVVAAVSSIACVAALATAPASAAVDETARRPVIKGAVGPGFVISVNKASVTAGRYKLVVNDMGTIHNWHIIGAGVDKKTSIPGTGKTVFKVRLKTGSYLIQCDQHPDTMNTTLIVT